MTQQRFRFCYFGELFILLHLAGVLHCSWWWVAFFYLIDEGEGMAWKRESGLYPTKVKP